MEKPFETQKSNVFKAKKSASQKLKAAEVAPAPVPGALKVSPPLFLYISIFLWETCGGKGRPKGVLQLPRSWQSRGLCNHETTGLAEIGTDPDLTY